MSKALVQERWVNRTEFSFANSAIFPYVDRLECLGVQASLDGKLHDFSAEFRLRGFGASLGEETPPFSFTIGMYSRAPRSHSPVKTGMFTR